MSRSRLPLPPVPAAARGTAPAGPRAAAPSRPPAAPLTSVAPFQAVPSPEPRLEMAVEESFVPMAAAPGGDLLERPSRSGSSYLPPAVPRPNRRSDRSALVTTGPSSPAGPRLSEPAPRVPRQSTAGSSSPAYGDWTKPSRPDDTAPETGADVFAEDSGEFVLPGAPGTTLIPERSTSRRRSADAFDDEFQDEFQDGVDHHLDDRFDDRSEDEVPSPRRGSATGPVTGGRAAVRAERQAADAVRRKAEKRSGSALSVLEDDQPRKPRRVVKGLVALTLVALGVLGVYSVVSPKTQEIAAQTPAAPSEVTDVTPETDALPALPTEPIELEPIVAAPIRVPVTVLNSTNITGLAAKIAANFGSGGWEAPVTGAYTAGDVAASTVFFTEGDENQRQAAVQLVDQFPQLQGPAPRFFELPAGIAAPGLVVVATGDWQP
jgi:hypothetical protein